MASNDPIKFFRVVVGDQVTVFREPGSAGITDWKVEVKPLQLWTTQLLVKMLREGRLGDEEEYRVLGANLYDILFRNDLGAAIRLSSHDDFMRIELEFRETQRVLSTFPWELLYCPEEYGREGSGQFLADIPNLILTRRLTLDGTPRNLRIEEPPLKLLFVASGPPGHQVAYQAVLDAIQGLGKKMIEVTSLLPDPGPDKKGSVATWNNFEEAVATGDYHAIHFLGHGKWDQSRNEGKGESTILFMTEGNESDPRSEIQVASAIGGKSCLKLVFLQACESARSDLSDLTPYRVFSGAAQQLAQKGIPAVVGMQSKIDHTLANLFARTFYEALGNRRTVDAALQIARAKMRTIPADSKRRLEFGFPVLYLRESDSLFAPAGSVAAQGKTAGSEFVICPWCQVRNNVTDDFCGHCSGALVCPNCKAPIDRIKTYCGKCRARLPEAVATSPTQPPATASGWDDDRPKRKLGNL